MQVITHAANVTELRFFTDESHKYKMAFFSDVHFDSVECDRELLTKHLKQAEAANAIVISNGDWFDAMQGRYDPRGSKGAIRPEYKHSTYIDCIVDDAFNYLSQFKVKHYHFNYGNHETNILKRLETDITNRLAAMLRGAGVSVSTGTYTGYIILSSARPYESEINREGFTTNRSKGVKVWYHHGFGGNAPRSKGLMTADIDQMQHADADIIVKGHDHNSWYIPITTEKLNKSCKIIKHVTHHIRLGSYKKRNDDGFGWEIEKGFNEPTLGGWMAEVFLPSQNRNAEIKIERL